MKKVNLKKISRGIMVAVILIAYTLNAFATQSVSLYVREHQTVVCQSLPAGCTVYACNFVSPSTAITTYSVGNYGGYIRVDSYFTGSVNVQCDQYYYYYVGSFRYAGHRTTYFSVTCKTINITLSDTYLEMTPDSYHNLTYTSNPNTSLYAPVVTWESSNLSVVHVSSTGRIHAIAPGTATITAHNGSGPDKTCTVVVQASTPTSITLNHAILSFPKGQSQSLSYTVTPSNASYTLTWTSSNNSVATVSNGIVYGVAPGNATVTVRISGTSISDICYVTIQPVNPTSIDVPAFKTLNVGQDTTIVATVTPSNADCSIIWTSSNPSVATVNDGVVHGIDIGSTRIMARISGTTLYDTCWVNVYRPSLTLQASASTGWVTPGTSITLTANNSSASIHYTTDGSTPTQSSTLYTGPIPVNDSLTLKAVAYHTNCNPSPVLSCNYKVNNFQIIGQSPTNYTSTSLPQIPSVTFNKHFIEGINYSNIKLYDGYSMSNVSSNGNEVIGEKYIVGNTLYFIPSNNIGNTTRAYRLYIPANALLSENQEPNWEYSVWYTVNTYGSGQLLQSISFENTEDSLVLTMGDRHIMHTSISPANGSYDTLYWNVADPSVVSVSHYGVIDALAVGSTTVTVTAVSGGNVISATAYVTVTGEFDILTTVSGGIGGSVYGDGTFNYNTTATVTAVANTCYHFVQWNDGDTTNPRVFTLTQDTTFTAVFAYNETAIGYEYVNACDSYIWKGNTYSVSGTYSFNTLTTMGCDSIITLDLTISHSTYNEEAVNACDNYVWNGNTYNTSGTYIYQTISVAGCDSTMTLDLTLNHSSQESVSAIACNSYYWNGSIYGSSGMYNYQSTNVAGCDSIITLNLTINHSIMINETAIACDNYLWNGSSYCTTGTYSYQTIDTNGCNYTATLYLTIKHSSTDYETATVCDNYLWNGNAYSTTGTYIYQSVNIDGCDSTLTLNLTVNHSTQGNLAVSTCNNYNWNGTIYDSSGIYTYQTINTAGCDSTVTLDLTINNNIVVRDTVTACESYTWSGNTYSHSGSFVLNKISNDGCDSTMYLNLTIHHSSTSPYITIRVCDSVSLFEQAFYNDTVISYVLQNANRFGCDSIERVRLYVTQTTHSSTTVESCGNFYWHNYNYTETPDTLPIYSQTDWNGCTSTDTLYLTIHHASSSTENIEACDSVVWHGTKYSFSASWPTYNVPGGNMYGCDSVVHLSLTIHHSSYSYSTLTACDSVSLWGQMFVNDTLISHDWTNANSYGCDSTEKIFLYVSQTAHTSEIVEACDSYYWHYYIYTQTPDTLPIYRHTDGNGCTSTDTLYLTIHQPSTYTEIIEACDSVIWHGTKYTYSANWPTYDVPNGNIYGCDSTVHLNLTIHKSISRDEYVTRNSSAYLWNDSTYTQSGTYIWVGTTEYGCDSVVTLHLTLNGVGISEIEDESSEIVVYPSPTNGIAYIKSSSPVMDVEVYNMNGAMVQHLNDNNKIDLTGMPTGVYLIRVSALTKTSVVKIIKK